MTTFHLFRIKVLKRSQRPLFEPEQSTSEILREAISQKPSAELRKNHTWHIGNNTELDENGIYFAIGRTTTATVPRYDKKEGNFTEAASDTAPFTHVLADFQLQVAGIAAKSLVAPTVPDIARKLEKVLNSAPAASTHEVDFEICPITDPETFIEILRSAYAIEKFSFTVSRPNPFDANKEIMRPLASFLSAASATRGRASISGTSLNADSLEDVARSAAVAGEDAEARVRVSAHETPVVKRLRGNAVALTEEEPDSKEKRLGLLARIRATFSKLRQEPDVGSKS
ncbi:MAG: hypothetical protein ACKVU1_03050 [bacterium]